MKRKNGFTLIELLAVIVVLAIIALIATPIVMNTIKNSKKGAAERTADNYVEQVETSLMTYRLEHGENLPDGEYAIDENGNLTGNGKTLTIEMSGTKPTSGTIVIENGQVKKESSSMTVGDYTVSYDTDNKTFVASENTGNDVEVLCKANTTKVSALVYGNNEPWIVSSYNSEEVGLLASESGKYTPGVTYTCNVGDGERIFYVLEENDDNTVSLILGTNLGDYVAWSSDGNNHKDEDESQQAVTAKAYLEEQTSEWTKLDSSQINLPIYDKIYKAAGNKTSGLPIWLNSYTDENVAYGYWTSTPDASSSDIAWFVSSDGRLDDNYVNRGYYDGAGVRPVITISKSQLG